MVNGTPITVPGSDQDTAFALGARWNEPGQTWYVPRGLDFAAFRRWAVDPAKPKLSVELVPKTCWCSNVRDHVPVDTWRALSREVYRQANYKCEICGCQGTAHPVENHEVWRYENNVQSLVRLIALCPACHLCKHPGFASINGRGEEVYEHLMRVNRWTRHQAQQHLAQAFQEWERRSLQTWKLDLSFLDRTYGLKVDEKR